MHIRTFAYIQVLVEYSNPLVLRSVYAVVVLAFRLQQTVRSQLPFLSIMEFCFIARVDVDGFTSSTGVVGKVRKPGVPSQASSYLFLRNDQIF